MENEGKGKSGCPGATRISHLAFPSQDLSLPQPITSPHSSAYFSQSPKKMLPPFCEGVPKARSSPVKRKRIKSGRRETRSFISGTATMCTCVEGWVPFMVPTCTPSLVQEEPKTVQSLHSQVLTYPGSETFQCYRFCYLNVGIAKSICSVQLWGEKRSGGQ